MCVWSVGGGFVVVDPYHDKRNPRGSSAMQPPVAPSAGIFSLITLSAASWTCALAYSMIAEMSYAATPRMNTSPVPVHDTATVRVFAYVPAPTIGESPTPEVPGAHTQA
jgi:hypothetical protein